MQCVASYCNTLQQSMDDLLTTKQLQDLLKVDRTTVYRLLKSGRITGVKVGNQWRFSRDDVSKLIPGATAAPVPASTLPAATLSPDSGLSVSEVLPLACVQAIQDVFSEIANVGSVTTTPAGQPITNLSNCSRFCQLIQSSSAGRAACATSWRNLTAESMPQLHFTTCHAGLAYACAHIEVNNKLEAVLVAGQFHPSLPEPAETARTVTRLASSLNLNAQELAEAAAELPVLDQRMQASIGQWLAKVAHTFSQIGKERTAFKDRLRLIAAMSTLDPA